MIWYHLILDCITWLEAQFYLIAFARRVVAVELNKSLCAAAEVNLKVNNIKNVLVIPCDSEVFARNILQKKCYTRKDTGEVYDFKSVLVDPPRSENCTGASRHLYVHGCVRQYHICFPLYCLFCIATLLLLILWFFFYRYQSSVTYPLVCGSLTHLMVPHLSLPFHFNQGGFGPNHSPPGCTIREHHLYLMLPWLTSQRSNTGRAVRENWRQRESVLECVCVCVCVRERETESARDRQIQR